MRAVPSSFVDKRTNECLRLSERVAALALGGDDSVGLAGALGNVMTSAV